MTVDPVGAALHSPLSGGVARESDSGTVALVVEEFLPPQYVEAVMTWVIEQRHEFTASKVLSGSGPQDAEDPAFRRSKVMFEPVPLRQLFERRLLTVVDGARAALRHPKLPITGIELQVTASNDGDFFKCHSDNAEPVVAARSLTFVYFLHREPKPYRGGHLTLYETTGRDGQTAPGEELLDIEPVRNRIVLFPSNLMHEVRTVECPSKSFIDSRFTINGWFHTSPRSAVHAQLHRRNRSLAGRRTTPGNR
jgi:Rps23 Pro-64 3,4-dihydroxylase Tpa1-like proline 4-hydroxylase